MCLPFWMKTCAGEPTSNEAAGVSDVPKADARFGSRAVIKTRTRKVVAGARCAHSLQRQSCAA